MAAIGGNVHKNLPLFKSNNTEMSFKYAESFARSGLYKKKTGLYHVWIELFTDVKTKYYFKTMYNVLMYIYMINFPPF